VLALVYKYWGHLFAYFVYIVLSFNLLLVHVVSTLLERFISKMAHYMLSTPCGDEGLMRPRNIVGFGTI